MLSASLLPLLYTTTRVGLLIADQQSTCSSGLTYSLSYCELQISRLFVEQTFFPNTIANDMSIHRVQNLFLCDLCENYPSDRGTSKEMKE